MYRAYTKDKLNKDVDVFIHDKEYCIDVGTQTGSDKFYLFNQVSASNKWYIKHNLNKYPSVTIVDSAENVVVGEVQYINNNELTVYFTAPFSGRAYLN